MIAFRLGQLALAALVVAVVVRRVRELGFRSQLDVQPFVSAMRGAIMVEDLEHARRIATLGLPAWVARVGEAALDAREAGLPVGAIVEETLADVRFESQEGIRTLRVLATIASATGLLGAIWEVMWMLGSDHGLLDLVPGLAQQVAFQNAMMSMVSGISIALFAGVSMTALRRHGRRMLVETHAAANALEECLEEADGMEEPSLPAS